MVRFAAVALTCILLGTPAIAEDTPQQTVEGAHEFMRRVTLQFNFSSQQPQQPTFFNYYDKMRIEPSSRCTSAISRDLVWRIGTVTSDSNQSEDASIDRYLSTYLNTYQISNGVEFSNSTKSYHRSTRAVDWSSVSAVEIVSAKAYGALDEQKRVVVVRSQPQAISLMAADVTLAKRLAYAMEFLRAACDISAETGF
jgi:hypothetical protein